MAPVIFILDESREIPALLERQLKSYGFTNIYSFTHPLQAFEMIRRSTIPDLIITGFSLPEWNGIELVNRVRDYYPEVYAIILAGNQKELPDSCPYPSLLLDVNNFDRLFRMVHSIFGIG